jgi:hypothetical protein
MTHRQPPTPSARRSPPSQVAQRQAARGGGSRARAGDGAPRLPTGTYNFVQLHGSAPPSHPVFVSPRLTHAQFAQDKPVVYAGIAPFAKSAMQWWSNYFGTYQPVAAFRARAKLPADKFVSWQTLQLGGHGMQRPMLGERRSAGRPEAKPVAKAETAAPAKGDLKVVANSEAKAPAAGGATRSGATPTQPFRTRGQNQ